MLRRLILHKALISYILITIPLIASAKDFPIYPEPFESVLVYSNINSGLVQKVLDKVEVTPVQYKIVACSIYTDKMGQYMLSRQEGFVSLNTWLTLPDITESQAKDISYVYSFAEGTTMQSRVDLMNTFIEKTFLNCINRYSN